MSQVISEHQSWVKDAVARFEGPLTLTRRDCCATRDCADVVQDTFLKLCAL